MEGLSTLTLGAIFTLTAIVTWRAGVALSKTVSTLDTRFKLGEAFGGLILLGIASSLPELAVILSAARADHTSIILGNILGGVAIQTLVMVILDFVQKNKKPLSYIAGSELMSIEVVFAMILRILAIAGILLLPSSSVKNINPFSIFIVIGWIGGLYFIDKIRRTKHLDEVEKDASPGRKHLERRAVLNHSFYKDKSNLNVIIIFFSAAFVTLVCGVLLEKSGSLLANHLNINSGLFAATVIALVCSMPEISSGIESILIGDNQLAISDIMGANAFMVVLFFIADLVLGSPVLSYATNNDTLLGMLGVVMMAIYAFSFILKPKKRYLRLGVDSIAVLLVYIVGTILITKLI